MKSKSKVLLSSIASIALCSSIAVGGTFALFTSESEVNIAVTSGKVDVVATADGLKTYSMGVEQAAGTFENGGTATLVDNQLELKLMTPGDKATFTIDVENNSTIAVQYKLTWTVEGELANGLEILANDAELADVSWTELAVGADVASIAVSVELPEEAGNEYQDKTANISFLLEAVQGNAFNGGTTIEDSEEDVALEGVFTEELLKKENIVINVGKANLTWATGGAHGSTPFGNETTKSVTIIGESPEVSTLTATGAGVGPIRVADGTLTVKNVEIIDETVSYAEDSWEFGYLEIGDGNADTLVFENCVFNKAIQITGNATFKNCKFNSNVDSEYAVWVCGGNATFVNCEFKGPRGLKMHEAYGSEIESVTVNLCTFEGLTKKPGIAIGNLNAETAVTIQNSDFIDCQAGDQGLFIYESDTDVTTFTFVSKDNTVTTSPITISTAEELFAFAADVNAGNSYSGKVVRLTKNINLENAEWTPIGQTGGYYASTYFQGTFDGQGYTISNLKISTLNEGANYAVGLFGFIDAADAIIKNVNVDGADIAGHHWVGVIAGYLTGEIDNCHVTNAKVVNTHANNDACGDKAGIIVGTINGTQGTITNCSATNSTVSAGRDAGQIAGYAVASQVVNCTANNVTVTATEGCTGANINEAIIGRVG